MSKATVVVDFAYKGSQRKGRGTGRKGLNSTLKYLQYRDKVQNQLAQKRGCAALCAAGGRAAVSD